MANAAQIARVVSPILGSAEAQTRFAAERLRRHGAIASPGQGKPSNLSDSEITLVLLAAMLGAPHGNVPARVLEYAEAEGHAGPTLGGLLTWLMKQPESLVRLSIDAATPHAVAVTEDDSVPRATEFGVPLTTPRPIIVAADRWHEIVAAIRALPDTRSGRPSTIRNYKHDL